MTKPFLLSAVIHILLLAGIMIYATVDTPFSVSPETVHIRILSRTASRRSNGRASASSPSEIPRETRERAEIPDSSRDNPSFESMKAVAVPANRAENIALAEITLSDIPQPVPSEIVRPDLMDTMNPFTGMESLVPEYGDSGGSTIDNPWSLSWANGKERGILSYPMINTDDFPDETGKLINLVIVVRVSPQGDVLSADIIPPGSGDTRIDRYMNNTALELVLEPWPDDEGIQEAHLRLLFVDGSQ